MTQARDLRQKLYLQLRPMQVPDTNPQPVDREDERWLDSSPLAAILATTDRVSGTEIVLYPGESNEILIQLQNLGNGPLELGKLSLEIEGSFPSSWFSSGWLDITDMEGKPLPNIDFFKEVVIFAIVLLIREGLYRFVSLLLVLHDYLDREREGKRFLWRSQVELSPIRKLEAVLNFKIPQDWFESEKSLGSGDALVLDYQGRVYVSYPASERQSLNKRVLVSTDFNLYVRPRSLYLNFLPEIYREVDLIGRLLKIFEQAFEPDVQALDALWAYLNPLIAPKELLPFLAHWIGWNLTPELTITQKRRLISQAMEIYRWRGTRKGLRHYLHLYTGLPLDEDLPEEEKAISIQENFRRDFTIGKTRLGDESNARIEGGQAYHFILRLRFPPNLWREALRREALICYSYSPRLSLRLWFLSFLPLRFPPNLRREALICYSYSQRLSFRLWFLSFLFLHLNQIEEVEQWFLSFLFFYLNQIEEIEQFEPLFFFNQNQIEPLIRQIVEQEKPAFCTYELYIRQIHPYPACLRNLALAISQSFT